MEITRLQRFKVSNILMNIAIKGQRAFSSLQRNIYVSPTLYMSATLLHPLASAKYSICIKVSLSVAIQSRDVQWHEGYVLYTPRRTQFSSKMFYGTYIYIWYMCTYIQTHHYLCNKTRHFPSNKNIINNNIKILKRAPNISRNVSTVRWRRSTGTTHPGIK